VVGTATEEVIMVNNSNTYHSYKVGDKVKVYDGEVGKVTRIGTLLALVEINGIEETVAYRYLEIIK
jgi:preprotein translocase subunit YajC